MTAISSPGVQDPLDFARDGCAIVPRVLSDIECDQVLAELATPPRGSRLLLREPWCQALARRLRQHPALRAWLGPDYRAVQCTYFEKTRGRNWLVCLHQDLSIPVSRRVESDALGAWSLKEGVHFVQPPIDVLQHLLAIRVHLDDCSVVDGALRVIAGTHRSGRIGPEQAMALRESRGERWCEAARGDVWMMHPLLLHASSKACGGGRRRVLHLLFGPEHLPLGLQWAMAV